jgi:hypothetical protein
MRSRGHFLARYLNVRRSRRKRLTEKLKKLEPIPFLIRKSARIEESGMRLGNREGLKWRTERRFTKRHYKKKGAAHVAHIFSTEGSSEEERGNWPQPSRRWTKKLLRFFPPLFAFFEALLEFGSLLIAILCIEYPDKAFQAALFPCNIGPVAIHVDEHLEGLPIGCFRVRELILLL